MFAIAIAIASFAFMRFLCFHLFSRSFDVIIIGSQMLSVWNVHVASDLHWLIVCSFNYTYIYGWFFYGTEWTWLLFGFGVCVCLCLCCCFFPLNFSINLFDCSANLSDLLKQCTFYIRRWIAFLKPLVSIPTVIFLLEGFARFKHVQMFIFRIFFFIRLLWIIFAFNRRLLWILLFGQATWRKWLIFIKYINWQP